ncbi:MAG: phosphodiester glycosidase family protein [Clostridia bacterium]|nr:phosphodiester glycosidase family protein [Clostridia bacterium]
MKYKINYSKHGSEQVVDRLCDYIEKWQSRKQNAAFVPVKKIQSRRPSNINRISDDNIEIKQHNDVKRVQKPQNTKKKNSAKTVLSRVGISFLTFLLAIVMLALCADIIVLHGPSESARDRFVLTVTETSAAGFLATWFLSDETVESIINNNAIVDSSGQTDPTLIKLPDGENDENNGDEPVDINSVQLIDIEGKTYKGKLLIVQNPKRVYIGTPAAYGNDKEGVTTLNMVKNDNALYGINGGGFYDTGKGNGGIPTGRENSSGIVISKGVLMYGSKSREYEVIGINKQGVLVLGKMTAQQALDSGIVEALNFGPYLVMNGKACEVGGFTEAGLNPRTAIGQRADGAMLLLTIDGRQPSSMGATYEDLIEIMMNYGAVNAANLDGGSSTYMAQNQESENNPQIITQCASLYGPRKMATSILVSRADQINTQYEQGN